MHRQSHKIRHLRRSLFRIPGLHPPGNQRHVLALRELRTHPLRRRQRLHPIKRHTLIPLQRRDEQIVFGGQRLRCRGSRRHRLRCNCRRCATRRRPGIIRPQRHPPHDTNHTSQHHPDKDEHRGVTPRCTPRLRHKLISLRKRNHASVRPRQLRGRNRHRRNHHSLISRRTNRRSLIGHTTHASPERNTPSAPQSWPTPPHTNQQTNNHNDDTPHAPRSPSRSCQRRGTVQSRQSDQASHARRGA
jgi:hypothetical protein